MTDLTEEEQEYFESQGETEIKDEEVVDQEEPEVEEKAAEEEPEEPEEPLTVPKEQYDGIRQAMDAERARARELKEQLEQMRVQQAEEKARLEERLKSYGLVDEEEVDPTQEVNQKLQATENKLKELEEQQKQNQIVNHINTQEAQFQQTTPDYDKAKNHYLSSRRNAYIAFGYDEQTAEQAVLQEISQLVGTAMQKQVNAAEKLYEAAKLNGYVPVTQKGEQQLKVIESGQSKAQSIPRGSAPKGELTAEALAEMDQKDFNNLPEEELLKVLGG